MAAGNKKIAKALRIARSGFLGGGLADSTRDGGWAGAGTGSLSAGAQAQRSSVSPGAGNVSAGSVPGGNGGADRLGSGSRISGATSVAERSAAMTNPAAQNARLGPNAAQAMAGAGVSPDTAIRAAMSINRSGIPAAARMAPLNAPAPSRASLDDETLQKVRQLIGGSTMPAQSSVMPNLTGSTSSVSSIPNVDLPITDFTTAANAYGANFPQDPRGIGFRVGVTNPVNATNPVGPLAQQSNLAAKGDYLGRINALALERSMPLNMAFKTDLPAVNVPATSATLASDYRAPSAPAVAQAPSIGSIKAADYANRKAISEAIALANSDYRAPSLDGLTQAQRNQLAFGSASLQTRPTEVGLMVEKLKAAASNPNLTEEQRAKFAEDIAALEKLGGIAVSPGSMLAPVPKGFSVNPNTGQITKSPGYNVVAGPYETMESPAGTFQNISFAMPSSVALTQTGVVPNPSLGKLPINATIARAPYDLSIARTTNIARTPDVFGGFGIQNPAEPSIGDLIAGVPEPTTRGIPQSASGEFYSSMPSMAQVSGNVPRDVMAAFLESEPATVGPLAQGQIARNPYETAYGTPPEASYLPNVAAFPSELTRNPYETAYGTAPAAPPAPNVAALPAELTRNPYETAYGAVPAAEQPVVSDEELANALDGTAPVEPVETAPVAPQQSVPPASTLPRSQWPVVDVVPRTPIPAPPNASIFGKIANAMLPENLFPNALYTQPTPPGQWLYQPPANRGALKGVMSVPYRVERGPIYGQPGVPEGYTPRIAATGMPDPNANTILFKDGGGMSFNPATGRYEYISRFRGSLDERPGSDRREEIAAKRGENRRLIEMGYSEEEIAAMSPAERDEALGRKGDRPAGRGKQLAQSLSLPELPEYVPFTLPTYNLPAPSPRVAEFTGQSGQPTSTNNAIANALRLLG